MSTQALVLTTLLPAALVLFVITLGLVLAKRGSAPTTTTAPGRHWPAFIAPLAVVMPFFFGAPFILGKWPPLPPVLGEEWIIYLAIIAAVAAFTVAALVGRAFARSLYSAPTGPAAAGMALRLPLAAAAVAALVPLALGIALRFTALRSAFENQVAAGFTGWALLLSIAVGLLLLTLSLERVACRVHNAGLPFALGFIATLSVPGLFMSSSAKLAQLALVLAMGPGLISLASLFFRSRVTRPGAFAGIPTLFMPVHITLWLTAYFYAEAPLATTLLACLAPAAILPMLLPPLRIKLADRPILGTIIPGILAILIMAAAVAIAASTYLKESEPDPATDMYSLAPHHAPSHPLSPH